MTSNNDTNDTETAIRKYLLYLEDPNKLRDEAEIEKAQKAVDKAQDPIQKVKALAELERASNIDEAPIRAGFVSHAKAWSEENDIPLSAFRQMSVPDEVLREAGFDLPGPKRRGRGSSAASEPRQRAKPVPADEIKAFILKQEGSFILTDIQSGIGGSQATVRKAVDELIEAGQVEKLGPVAEWSGRGRVPMEYSRV